MNKLIIEDNLYAIHNEDCLITMSKMQSDSIDFVITSPPYDDIRNYNGYKFEFEKIAKELLKKVVLLFGLLAMQQKKNYN